MEGDNILLPPPEGGVEFILTSKSLIKVTIVTHILKKYLGVDKIVTIDTGLALIPPQPVGNAIVTCAEKRIEFIKKQNNVGNNSVIISIENGIYRDKNNKTIDCCCVVLKTNKFQIVKKSDPIEFPKKYYENASQMTPNNYQLKNLGFSITVGELIHRTYPHIKSNNWMSDALFGGIDRTNQIKKPLVDCILEYILMITL